MNDVDITGRLRWRCRRGMLELDLVLAHFLQQHCARLTAQQLAEFDALLDLPDQDLWSLVREKHVTGSEVVALLRASQGGF
ncbi:succinate dehydrogenase assembly factor 2 [Sulfuriferula nivalis]|nr:succinate dehydrogenase assembly factor 2 [Sulfuriferula nivalis]